MLLAVGALSGWAVMLKVALPLAWKESIAYRVITVLSFSAMSVATVGAAVAGPEA